MGRQWQNILTALIQIWANKARSVLTTLGIIIAVTSTISVVSFVQGFGDYMTNMLRGFGTNIMFIVPWIPSGMQGRMLGRVLLDVDDVRAVGAECDKVRRISPMVFMPVTVEYGRNKAENIEFQGVTEQFQTIRNFFVDKGRFFGPIDVDVVGREAFIKNKRVNVRLSSADLMDIQARAMEEGVPYQTLIASVLHKYVSGRLRETKSRLTSRSIRTRAKAARAG